MTTKTDTQSIGERMAARQSDARTRITAALWAENPDVDHVAAAALAAGIDPAEVDKLAAKIGAARATLAAAEAASERLPQLAKDRETATAKARATAAALAKAEEADATARDALGDTEAAIAQAEVARRAALQAALSDTIPSARRPPWLAAMEKIHREGEAREAAESRAVALRQVIRWRKDRVAALRKEVEALERNKNTDREQIISGGGGLRDAREVLPNRLKIEERELAAAEKELKALEKAAA